MNVTTIFLRLVIPGLIFSNITLPIALAQEKATTPPLTPLIEMRGTGDQLEISVYEGAGKRSVSARTNSLRFGADTIWFGQLVFTRDTLHSSGLKIAYSDIADVAVIRNTPREKEVRFLGRATAPTGTARLRGNRIGVSDTVMVPSGDFVRGNVVAAIGSAMVAGEVNRNVIAFFGDITLAPGAVVRGHLVTFGGTVTVDRSAALYGEVVAGEVSRTGRSRYVRNLGDYLRPSSYFIHNRVDGVLPLLGFTFGSPDSSLPLLNFLAGYAFSAEGTRWKLKLSQRVDTALDARANLEAYRFARTDDLALYGQTENTLAMLVAGEDFFDYFEARGFAVSFAVSPGRFWHTSAGYRYELNRWLETDRDLGSLFGGDKVLPSPFRSYDDSTNQVLRDLIHDVDFAEISLSSTIGELPRSELFDRTHARLTGEFVWSVVGTGASYNYRVIRLAGEQVKSFGAMFAVLVRGNAVFGDGNLPPQRLAYLGGTNTLWGYKQKEFVGKHSWHLNVEPRLRVPRTPCSISLLYDAGSIYERDDSVWGEIRQSVGGALYLFQEKGIISLAQRLDSEASRKVQVYVRLALTLP